MTVVVARALVPTDAGLFFSATSLFLLVSAAARLGTPTGLVWALSGQRARGENDLLLPTIRLALIPVAGFGIASGLVLFLAADALSPLLVAAPRGGAADGMPALLRALAVFVPISAVYDAVCAATRGAGSMRPTLVAERLFRPVLQCGLVFAIAWSASAFWVTLAWAVPYAASLYLVFRMMRAQLRGYTGRGHTIRAPRALRSAFWKFSLPRAISGLAQTVLQRLDIVMVGAIRGPRDAAIYAAATRFLVLGQTAGLAISLAVQPNLGEELGRKDRLAAGTIYRMSTAWLIIVTWPLYLFSIIAPNLVTAIFGHGYQSGADVIRILSAAMLISTGCGMVDMVLNMAGRTWWNLANVSASAVVFVGLDLLLIPTWGIRGAALGWACAILINNLLPLAQIGLSLRLHPFGRATALAALWAGVACFALPEVALLAIPLDHDLLTLGVLVASGCVYCAGLYVRRVDFALDRLLSGRKSRAPSAGPRHRR